MSLGDFAVHLFSPAKLFYIGYLGLVYLRHGTSLREFLSVSLFFIALQIGHDDYLRILLNGWAYKKFGLDARGKAPGSG